MFVGVAIYFLNKASKFKIILIAKEPNLATSQLIKLQGFDIEIQFRTGINHAKAFSFPHLSDLQAISMVEPSFSPVIVANYRSRI